MARDLVTEGTLPFVLLAVTQQIFRDVRYASTR
jgi:hypothetical protein